MTTPASLADSVAELRATPAWRTDRWQLQPATVIVGESASLMIQFDGEGAGGGTATDVPATLLAGTAVAGDRVMVERVPPNQNFVVANLSRGMGPSRVTSRKAVDSQSYNDIAVHNILVDGGDTMELRFIKYFNTSRIHVAQQFSGFVGTATTGMTGVLGIDGTNYDGPSLLFNPANTHLCASATYEISDILPAGIYLATVKIRRYVGAGTISFTVDDVFSCTVTESP